MRRMRLLVAVAVAMVATMALSGAAWAADPPGRGASLRGLEGTAERASWSWGESQSGNEVPIDQVSSNAQDPSTPGVEPGGGGFEP
jgi:opacity protein-like surface antigen